MKNEQKTNLGPPILFCIMSAMAMVVVFWIHLAAGFTLAFCVFILIVAAFVYWRGRVDERNAFQSGARTAADLMADSAALNAYTATRAQQNAKRWARTLEDKERNLDARERSLWEGEDRLYREQRQLTGRNH